MARLYKKEFNFIADGEKVEEINVKSSLCNDRMIEKKKQCTMEIMPCTKQ